MIPLEAMERTIRVRNAAHTKAAILDAARLRFGREGYDDVGLRDLARDAGVDAAMVCRYFGSKEELLVEALKSCHGQGRSLTEFDRDQFGPQVAHQLIYEPQSCDKLSGLLIMLRASGSAKATEIVRRSIEEDFLGPFETWLGGPQARIRARLASSVVMGLAMSRSLSGEFGDEAQKAALYDRLAEVLQRCVEE